MCVLNLIIALDGIDITFAFTLKISAYPHICCCFLRFTFTLCRRCTSFPAECLPDLSAVTFNVVEEKHFSGCRCFSLSGFSIVRCRHRNVPTEGALFNNENEKSFGFVASLSSDFPRRMALKKLFHCYYHEYVVVDVNQ